MLILYAKLYQSAAYTTISILDAKREGSISVSVGAKDGRVAVSIRDDGRAGIPGAVIPRALWSRR